MASCPWLAWGEGGTVYITFSTGSSRLPELSSVGLDRVFHISYALAASFPMLRSYTTYWYVSAFPWSGVEKGLNHNMEKECPNTALMFIHLVFLAHLLSSFFNCSMPWKWETTKLQLVDWVIINQFPNSYFLALNKTLTKKNTIGKESVWENSMLVHCSCLSIVAFLPFSLHFKLIRWLPRTWPRVADKKNFKIDGVLEWRETITEDTVIPFSTDT